MRAPVVDALRALFLVVALRICHVGAALPRDPQLQRFRDAHVHVFFVHVEDGLEGKVLGPNVSEFEIVVPTFVHGGGFAVEVDGTFGIVQVQGRAQVVVGLFFDVDGNGLNETNDQGTHQKQAVDNVAAKELLLVHVLVADGQLGILLHDDV